MVLLPSLIDSLISEKRIQFRDKNNLQIQAHLENSYGLFVNIVPSDLSRVLSNTINNSVEAFDPNKMSTIDLTVESNNSHVVLRIKDNGKGIPQHILAKLGQMGVSFGKEGTQSGSGLGVYHAKQTIESFNGTYQIESVEGAGTTVFITLPRANALGWFVQSLNLNKSQTIVATDDDHSILEIWKQRFGQLVEENKINLLTFSSGVQLGQWISENKIQSQSALYLVDYEFLGQPMNGLDLIEKYNLSAQAILVTSRYEEKTILNKCEELKVKLIPKGMAPLVPIKIEAPQPKIDLCLLDDDDLVRMSWAFAANTKGLNLICFESEEDFLLKHDSLKIDTPIYIDVCLKNNVKGQDVAGRISKLGFKNLHLATGYESDQINKPASILSITGKDFPL